MNSGYRLRLCAALLISSVFFLLFNLPILAFPLVIKSRTKEIEDELKKLKAEHERRERSHSRAIASLSLKLDSLEWQIKLSEPFIKKQLFNLETRKGSIALEMEEQRGSELGNMGEGSDFESEEEVERWTNMIVFSPILALESEKNTVVVFVPLTESLKERNILLRDLESMTPDTSLIKREEGNHIHFAERASKRVREYGHDEKRIFVLNLRVARFQENRAIAIFENNMHFVSILGDIVRKNPAGVTSEILYPRHIIEWVKGCADATLVDSKSFNNDPLAFFLCEEALNLTSGGKRVDVLDIIVNNRFIHQKRHKLLIESLSTYGHI